MVENDQRMGCLKSRAGAFHSLLIRVDHPEAVPSLRERLRERLREAVDS
jgi:hypothetical protein